MGKLKLAPRNKDGNFRFLDGSSYYGGLKNGKPHGQGTASWPNGAKKYEGQYKNGKAHGRGLFTDLDGNAFNGEFQNGKMQGHGVVTSKDGMKYDGEWQNGKFYGKGIYTWPNGEKYDGEFTDGKRHGRGVFTWRNGDKYDGQWHEDKKHGRGVKTDPDYNIIHAGKWVDDEPVQYVRTGHLDQCCVSSYAMSVTLCAILDNTVDSETLNYVFVACCCCISRYAWTTLSLAKTS